MVWQGIAILCIAYLAGNTNAFKARVINGMDANIEDYPYQASIRYNNLHFCGGAIISDKHIVTAAQCLKNEEIQAYDSITVVTGTSYRKSKGNSHNIASIAIHPNYSYDGKRIVNDIAVITLKNPIAFDENQQKINLPKNNFQVGDEASITGWGSVKRFPVKYPKQLQVLKSKITSNEECQKKVLNPRWMIIDETVFCTIHKNGSGPCIGDAGGPLAVNGELVGIISWIGGLLCASGAPDVYTNVYKYTDFINSAMQ